MLTEVVAGRMAEAEEARTLRRDATALVERLAAHARAAGLEHPVAAAVARAARVSRLAGPEDFADRIGIPCDRLVEAESGAVRFGDLPVELDAVLAALDLDLLSLADLAREWSTGSRPTGQAREAREVRVAAEATDRSQSATERDVTQVSHPDVQRCGTGSVRARRHGSEGWHAANRGEADRGPR